MVVSSVTAPVSKAIRHRLAIVAISETVTTAGRGPRRGPVNRMIIIAVTVAAANPITACGEPTGPGGAEAAAIEIGARPLHNSMSPARRFCGVCARFRISSATVNTSTAMTNAYGAGTH